jgi:hypothetical protein
MTVGGGAVARAQQCPALPGNAYAFLALDSSPSSKCPDNPIVRWVDPQVTVDCSWFDTDAGAIQCGADTRAACVETCRAGATAWDAGLTGRFDYVFGDADFCDPDDGRTSVGGSTTICDGTLFGSNVLAVTLRINFVGGGQNGNLVDADITVNQAFDSFFAANDKRFRATVAHELGHVLGLDHPDQCGVEANVLMRSSAGALASDPCFVEAPTIDDLTGARIIYPLEGALCGDPNGSGTVTVSDGVQVLNASASLASTCSLETCDVDGNGSITLTDGVNVLRGAAGLSFPQNCP